MAPALGLGAVYAAVLRLRVDGEVVEALFAGDDALQVGFLARCVCVAALQVQAALLSNVQAFQMMFRYVLWLLDALMAALSHQDAHAFQTLFHRALCDHILTFYPHYPGG